MKITIDIASDPDLVSPVVASSVIRDGVCYITVNPHVAPAQLPFVVAHELGHLFARLIAKQGIALHPKSDLDTVQRIVENLLTGTSGIGGLDVTPPKPWVEAPAAGWKTLIDLPKSEPEPMTDADRVVYLTEALHRIEDESRADRSGATRDDLLVHLGLINLLAEQGLAYTTK